MLERARILINEHGWLVQGVSDHGCVSCEHTGKTPQQTGSDPYLYTVGLTAAGLPELLLRLTGKNSREWMNTGTRMLNQVARHGLHTDLSVGQLVQTGVGGVSAVIAEPLSLARDTIWPGLAYQLYGHRVRVVEVLPNW